MFSTKATCFKCKGQKTVTYNREDVKETVHGRAYITTKCPEEGCNRSITTLISKKNLIDSAKQNEESPNDSQS